MNDQSPTARRVAVVGLGAMGYGMAQSLKRAGFQVAGCDVVGATVARFAAEGGSAAANPAEAARGADIVVTVVVNAQQTEAVLFGENGIVAAMPAGGVLVSSATMDPDVARRLAARVEAAGKLYLDAPISGGAKRAAEGKLTILASGSRAAFAKARPALDAMAAKLYELGDPPGQGAAFKMVNQLLAGVHIAAACEAITFAARQGLDLAKVYEVITASAGNSWMFENRVPHCSTAITARAAPSTSSSRTSASSRTWRAAPNSPFRWRPRRCRCSWRRRAPAWARDDDSSVARIYARLSGTKLPGSGVT